MSATPPEFGPDLDLIPTSDRPGLYVYAPVLVDLLDDPERRWPQYFGPAVATVRAAYACACGFVRRGVGPAAADIVANCHQHASSCSRAPRLAVPADSPTSSPVDRPVHGVARLTGPQFTLDPDLDDVA